MLEISKANELPSSFGEVAVAIGKFDGVHLGHAQLIHELVEASADQGLAPVIATFDRHPNAVLKPDQIPQPISGPRQKSEILDSLGVEVCLTLTFDQGLANLSPLEFVDQVLVPMSARLVFVGEGFRFGRGGEGRVSTLRELGLIKGFTVREVAHVLLAGKKVSSTLIREQLDAGRIELANAMLGREHCIVGEIEHGRKLGRTLGFPTANFSRSSEGYLPVDGVYAGWLIADGVRYPAAHSVGTNDSVEAVPRLLESHVIGRDDLDLYGKTCTAEFVAQVRPWSKFGSLEELVQQISNDVSRASEILRMIES